MIFYSHSKTDKQHNRYGSKRLIDHINGVKGNALNSLYPNTSLPLSPDVLEQFISDICDLHDLGKYTLYFQDYLLGRNYHCQLKRHSFIGACTIFNKYFDKDSKLATIGFFLIVKHHGNLDAIGQSFKDKDKKFEQENLEKQRVSIIGNSSIVSEELGDENLMDSIQWPEPRKGWLQAMTLRKVSDISNYFLTNYTFSLLIEADKLDASDTPLYKRKAIPTKLVDEYIARIVKERNIDLENPQNKLRTAVKHTVTAHIKDDAILEHKLFALTAPTGIGKTLTALDFAIKLKEKIRKKEDRNPQIICALPFINIIEQTLEEYHKVLPNDISVLAHYQFADVFEQDRQNKIDPDDEKAYEEKLMQMDTWQADVVITSFVQLLHTLIGYRNKILKKFNHLAGSIIIMDEVQNIPLNLVPLVGASLYYLANILDARIILMTATEPLIFPLANQEILQERNVEAKAFPLLPDAKDVFQQFKRTKLIPINLEKEITPDEFVELFLQKWDTSLSCLIVCNTVNRSVEVFEKVKETIEIQNQLATHPVFYLSTNIIPFHRIRVIQQIKKLKKVAPIDSIVQVAGRINRNNDLARMYSPVYLMNFGDCDKVYGRLSASQVVEALKTTSGFIPEDDYYGLVRKYFQAKTETYEVSRNIFKAMETLKYDGTSEERKNYNTVSSFQVIRQNNQLRSVFIATDTNIDTAKHKTAKEVLEAFDLLKKREYSKDKFNKDFKRDFQQRIVNIPNYYLENLVDERFKLTEYMYVIPEKFVAQYYTEIGFNRDIPEPPLFLTF